MNFKRIYDFDCRKIFCQTIWLLHDKYFIFESLKKYFHETSYCSFVIQFQQKVESKKIVKLKIVEKSKIEFISVSFVKFLNTYEKKLTILTNWFWFHSLNKKTMTIVEFKNIHDKYKTKCMHCLLTITKNRNFESFKKHFQKSFECSFVLQFETKKFEISKNIKRTKLKIFEIVKFISIVANFDYFDSTFLCNIRKFNLFCEIANFLQQFRQRQYQYRKSNLLILLFDYLRNFALIWYKKQNETIVKKI